MNLRFEFVDKSRAAQRKAYLRELSEIYVESQPPKLFPDLKIDELIPVAERALENYSYIIVRDLNTGEAVGRIVLKRFNQTSKRLVAARAEVKRRFQRRNIGRYLVNHLIGWAFHRGFRT